ncbi:2,3-diphosphoglycerate-dependent phosphoglycerate mutase [Leptolyngbya sp. FACHB-261]|uniref:2,3-bisphosphoglycerate-dependent phosphoglycerate mutase n=1 Tax=Leptolyngbya sp. FACHB-261 TaxID=2692806 RepID=UPI001689D100|nr:2,3-bisphosphoglycerate-dependent phosphoglycerate mutase [Leptolyngbya sp. FACHB-261]MBD2100928.1 2,3-bisphosphoglycerate-dependent phosphoglycerate mutase [Leptolyngbya sp. FACHB-261]
MALMVIVRHGQSIWNLENRFTGWTDVDLTEEGRREAREAGEQMAHLHFDIAFTSKLKRAQETLNLILRSAKQTEVPVTEAQALNERHYGDLQGLNKAETAQKYGEEQVHLWRRSYSTRPPGGESLEDTAIRTLDYFHDHILPELDVGKNILISAHGNTIRALLMDLDHLSPEQVEQVEIMYCVPIVFEYQDRHFTHIDLPRSQPLNMARLPARLAESS